MKKITFLIIAMAFSPLLIAQVLPLDFEDGSTTVSFEFNGIGSIANIDNPDSNNNSSSKVLQFTKTTNAAWFAGIGWGSPTGPTLLKMENGTEFTVKIWSAKPNVPFRLEFQKPGNVSVSVVQTVVNANEWVDVTFDFESTPYDNEYSVIVLQPDWDQTNCDGANPACTFGTQYYVDDIFQTGAPAASCNDGIKNGDEEDTDCGGSCAPCTAEPMPATDAPEPTDSADDVAAIFSDTYSILGFQNAFGAENREILDIESNGNEVMKVQLGFFGNGYGNTDVTIGGTATDGVLVFDYWTSNSTQFNVFVISPGPTESSYAIGGDEALVTETWTHVEVPYTHFSSGANGGAVNLQDAFQWKIDGNGTVYLDNIYFRATGLGLSLSNDEFKATEFTVSPNPSNSVWVLKGQTQITAVQVFDLLGKEVISVQPNALEVELDASNLNTGLYLAKIASSTGTKTIKLVKN